MYDFIVIITFTNPYSWTLTDPRGSIILSAIIHFVLADLCLGGPVPLTSVADSLRSINVQVVATTISIAVTINCDPRGASWAALAEDESADRLQTGSSRLPLPQRPGSVLPCRRPPVCGGPRRPAVSSLGINEYTRRACDAPVNSRRPRVSGGRGSRMEQSAGRCHFVAIAVDIQETA